MNVGVSWKLYDFYEKLRFAFKLDDMKRFLNGFC